jgi:DNA modification methylase
MKKPRMILKYLDPKTLKENPMNWRTHPDDQRGALKDSLQRVGWAGAALYNSRTKRLIDGHLRREEAIRRGELLPTLVGSWSPSEEKYILATLDPITGLAEADEGALVKLLKDVELEIPDAGDVLALVGDELGVDLDKQIPPAEDDEAPEPRRTSKTKRGTVIQLGPHRVMCGDCTNEKDMAKLMGTDKADLVWTDPPYGVDAQEKAVSLNKRGAGGNKKRNAGDIQGDALPLEECARLWKDAFNIAVGHTTDTASFYCCAPQGGDQMTLMAVLSTSWQVKHELMWLKDKIVFGRADYHYRHEPILFGWKKNKTHRFFGDRKQDSVFEIPKPHKSDLHPTMKPVELVRRCVQNSTQAGQIVLDMFGGSGSTLIACDILGRPARIMEIDPVYIDVIVERYNLFRAKGKI